LWRIGDGQNDILQLTFPSREDTYVDRFVDNRLWITDRLDNDLFVLLHRVKIETRSEKNSPREVSRLTTGVNHHRSRLSWVCSIEICFLSRLLLTRIVFCLFEIDERYKYKNDSWLTNTTLRSELESRDWKVNHRAVTRNHFLMKAYCLFYGQNHFCSWQPSIFEVISLF